MRKFEVTYKPFGEAALLIEWPSRIDEEILFDILSFQQLVESKFQAKIEETVNTYNSLTIFFNPNIISMTELLADAKQVRQTEQISASNKNNIWEIPVCYDPYFGIDLEEISNMKNLAIEELIKLHSETLYTVYFIGFLPGFLYLGGLPEKLSTPRKKTPRSGILKGAVAIGGSQTGIYPQESPGGWNIIGNSPVPLFDVSEDPPCTIKAGDKIKFSSISKSAYEIIIGEINNGSFELKSQPV